MKVNKLTASNFMRLNVEVEMDGHDVVVTGKNETGKSTFIDCIWFALTGKNIPNEPIQQGKESASLEVTISREDGTELICKRTFKKDGKDTLSVKTPEGAKFTSPQQFLNTLIGEISFDPFEFIAKQPAQQKQQLQRLLGIDTTELESNKKVKLAEKLAQEKLIANKEAELDKIPDHGSEPLKPRTLDEVTTKQKAITDKLKEKNELEAKIQELNGRVNANTTKVAGLNGRVKTNLTNLENLREQIKAIELANESAYQIIGETNADTETAKAEILTNQELKEKVVVPNGGELETIISDINAHNEKVKEQGNRTLLEGEIKEQRVKLSGLAEQIDKLEEDRITLIRSAKMPIAGLDFSDDGLTFDSLPFSKGQFSTAKMNMIGFQIAVAMNPKLRILKVKDWVLMDSETKEQVKALAKENDFQLFIETVTDDKDIGFIISE